jgi:hypothetical protein
LFSNICSVGIASILLGDSPLWTAINAATALSTEQSLAKGEFRHSPLGNFKIGLDGTSGELVVVESSSKTNAWASGVGGGRQLVLGGDGNLVVRDAAGTAIWSTNTNGHAGSRLTIEDSGEASIVHGTLKVWSTVSFSNKPQPQPQPQHLPKEHPNLKGFEENVVLGPLDSLPQGIWVSSPSGGYKVGLNPDGDFLLRDSDDRTIWRANVQGGGT